MSRGRFPRSRRLRRSFFARPTEEVARELVGCSANSGVVMKFSLSPQTTLSNTSMVVFALMPRKLIVGSNRPRWTNHVEMLGLWIDRRHWRLPSGWNWSISLLLSARLLL